MQEHDAPGAPERDDLALAPLSDPGRVRTENQDALAVLENTSRERLILVADGMGGHRGGETASKICLQIVERVFREPHGTPEQRLRRGLELANEEIYSHALANPELKGMGTTAVVALLSPDRKVWIAWVGDSRCYRLRNGALESLTRDHSLMAEWIAIGVISPDAAITHPRRHELTRALGQSPDVTVDVLETELRPGDRLLLCSDGLHGCVADRELKRALGHGTAQESARALIDAANAKGGSDNVTVIVAALPLEAVNMPAGAAGPEPAALLVPEAAHAREALLDLTSTADLAAPLELAPTAEVAAELGLFEPTADLRADPPIAVWADAPTEPLLPPENEPEAQPEGVAESEPVAQPQPVAQPEPIAQSEPALDADISFADLDAEIAAVAAESELAAAPPIAPEPDAPLEEEASLVVAESVLDLAAPSEPEAPPANESTDFLLPSEQRIEIPLMTPVRRRRGLDATSVVAGIGGTLVIAALGSGIWLYTGSRREPVPVPVPAAAAVQPQHPVIARSAPVVRAPAPATAPAPEPPRAIAPAPAPAAAPALVAVPATAPTIASVAPPPVAPEPAREPAKLVAPTPPAPPAESVPAAADPSAAPSAAALPTARGFELPAPVTRFVDDWLRALSTHDHALLATLGFPDEPAAFAGTARSRDGYRLVAADIDEERSHGGRVYLRMVVSYAFRDASGRFRTQDEQRFILSEAAGGLRFEGRWQQ